MIANSRSALLAALAAATMFFAPPASAQTFSDDQRHDIEHIVTTYLLSHPEVIRDVMAEMERRQREAVAETHRATIRQNDAALFNSSHQVVLGNPQGNVTMVEFFDYNCGYCKRALLDTLSLLKTDSNLKLVLKEFPVLGAGSVAAAHVAIAARMQDSSGTKYLEFHRKLLEGRGQADQVHALAIAKDVGFDMARLEKDMDSDEVKQTINENIKLAAALGVTGTPSYVVGTELVVGAVGLEALHAKIEAERK
jgi:protein-disulfide isomerase